VSSFKVVKYTIAASYPKTALLKLEEFNLIIFSASAIPSEA